MKKLGGFCTIIIDHNNLLKSTFFLKDNSFFEVIPATQRELRSLQTSLLNTNKMHKQGMNMVGRITFVFYFF